MQRRKEDGQIPRHAGIYNLHMIADIHSPLKRRHISPRPRDAGDSEEEDRDDVEFWNQQKVEYLKQNPSHAGMFDDLDEDEQEVVEINDRNGQ